MLENKTLLYSGLPEKNERLSLISEVSLSKKTDEIFLTGLMQRAEVKNQNKRSYPKQILEREVKNYLRIIDEKRSIGELDHPDRPIVNLSEVSHMVTKLWWEGEDVRGEIKLLDTPKGNIAKQLLNEGVKLGISSRGIGSVKKKGGIDVVQDDFMLICWDLVSDPSTDGAWMMNESKNIEINTKEIFVFEDRIDRIFNDILVKI